MNINEIIRNKRKLVEKLRGYIYKITTTSAANYPILPYTTRPGTK